MNPPALELHSEQVRGIIATIVETVHPLRILVFGSVARGAAGPDSDLDVLVVMPDGIHRRKTAQRILRALVGCGVAKDILVATEKDIADFGANKYLFLNAALRDGKELYRAA